MRPLICKTILVCALVVSVCKASDSASCGFPLAAQFTEDMITLSWGDIPRARAFNVYADWGKGFTRANFAPVTINTRYCLIWIDSAGKKQRVVKGNRVVCRVAPLFAKITGRDTLLAEGARGCAVVTNYFKDFSVVLSDSACDRIVRPRPVAVPIFPGAVSVDCSAFRALFTAPAREVYSVYKSKIDPRDAGACVPFSTIVAKYFTKKGITCYRAQGQFIGAFHSFNLVVVDGVEYVLDFTADQFIPHSSPVLIPRSYCFADSCGAPTAGPHGTFTPFYLIDKVFAADQIDFSNTPPAGEYKRILDSLERK